MKKFKLLSFLLIIALLAGLLPSFALAAEAPEAIVPETVNEPEVLATKAIAINAETGDILFQRDADATANPYFLGQLMTLLLIGDALDLQSISLNDTVTASGTFQTGLEGATVAGISPGEVLTVEQLLYLLASPGYMDAANILAEFNSGSVTAFVAEMNQRAQDLGCTRTHFVNATGMPTDGQYSTAHDLALITAELLKKPSISQIMQTLTYNIPATQYAGARTVNNENLLLKSDSSVYYRNAYSGKTGGVTEEGANLMAAASYNELDIIAIVLGSQSTDTRFTDAVNLFTWSFTNYSFRTLLSSTDILDTVPVEMGSPESVSVHAEDQIRMVMPVSQELGEVRMEFSYTFEQSGEPLHAPVTVGQYVGDVTVYLDGVEMGTSRLVTSTSSDISRIEYLRSQLDTLVHTDSVRRMVTVLLVILAVYLLLVIFYRIQRSLHLRSLRRARKDRAIARASQEIQWLDIPQDQNGVPVVSLPDQEQPAPEDSAGEEAAVYEQAPEDAEEAPAYEQAPEEAEEAPEDAGEEAPAEEQAPEVLEEEAPVEDGQEYYEEAPADGEEYYEDAPAEGEEYYEEAPADGEEYYEDAPADGEEYYEEAPEDDSYLDELEDQEGFFDEDDIDPDALDGPYHK